MSGSALVRVDGRRPDELRPVKITRNFIKYAEGSVLIEMGETKVICTVSVEEKVPAFLRGQNRGWVTAEYAMLPRATPERVIREASKGRQGGRTLEIQRLIGRSLRAVTDMDELGERTFWVDCDVIQADGGTRTASVTGAFVALEDAVAVVRAKGLIKKNPLRDYLAAVSIGKVGGEVLTDLCYAEDSLAEVDLNLVMTGKGQFVEVQGTAEKWPFTLDELNKFLTLGWKWTRWAGGPDSMRPALPGRAAPSKIISVSCCGFWRACRRSAAERGSCACWLSSTPAGVSRWWRATCTAGSRRHRPAVADSGTTRSSTYRMSERPWPS